MNIEEEIKEDEYTLDLIVKIDKGGKHIVRDWWLFRLKGSHHFQDAS